MQLNYALRRSTECMAIAVEHVAHGGDFHFAVVLQLNSGIEVRLSAAADADKTHANSAVRVCPGR